jgi:hypothetical protein
MPPIITWRVEEDEREDEREDESSNPSSLSSSSPSLPMHLNHMLSKNEAGLA